MPPVTVDAMVEQALVRVNDVTDTYPSTRGPMYRRVGVRQRQIYVRAAQVNPEYYGRDVVAALTNNTIILSALAEEPELIQRIEIFDRGTSTYAAGREITVITMTDPEGELKPRATIRDRQLVGVGTDLAGVTSARIWYAHVSSPFAATETGGSVLELDQPWDTLLEVDLAAWIIGKATALDSGIRDAAIKMFGAEATDLMAEFEAHLRTGAPTVQRFMSPLSRPGAVL